MPEQFIDDNENRKLPLDNIKVRFITHQGGCGGTRQDAHSLDLGKYCENQMIAGLHYRIDYVNYLDINDSFKRN